MLVLALAPVLAEPPMDQAPCTAWLAAQVPADGATAVPNDAVPSVVIDGTCGPVGTYDVHLDDADGRVWSGSYSDEVGGRVVQVFDAGPLEPDTGYTVSIEGQYLWESWTFRTGPDASAPWIDVPVGLEVDEAVYWESGGVLDATLQARIVGPDGLIGRVRGAEGALDEVAATDEPFWAAFPIETPTVCAVPEVLAVDGTWHAGVEVCFEFVPEVVDGPEFFDPAFNGGFGCSSAPGFLGVLLTPWVVLATRRR